MSIFADNQNGLAFVGMVDQNGKLLVGQGKTIPISNITNEPVDTARNSIHITQSKIDDLVDLDDMFKL